MSVTVTGRAFDRSVEQRLAALERANDIRARRARLKRELRAGRVLVAPLLLEPPEYIDSMKVFDLLLAMPHWGGVKANRLLSRAGVSPSKTIGGLSERQRRELAGMVSRRG
jgi:hypothetical protein